jgi:hypothetical protein
MRLEASDDSAPAQRADDNITILFNGILPAQVSCPPNTNPLISFNLSQLLSFPRHETHQIRHINHRTNEDLFYFLVQMRDDAQRERKIVPGEEKIMLQSALLSRLQ